MNDCTPPQQIITATPSAPNRVREGIRAESRRNLVGEFDEVEALLEPVEPVEPVYGLNEVVQDMAVIYVNLYRYPDRLTEELAEQNSVWFSTVALHFPQTREFVGDAIGLNNSVLTGERAVGG